MFDRGFKSWCEKYAVDVRKAMKLRGHDPLQAQSLAQHLNIDICNPSDVPDLSQPAIELLSSAFPFRHLVSLGPKLTETPYLRVHRSGSLSEAEVARLYAEAKFVVFPSFYEGFGLPPLEAMACGTPVVVSDAASLPEVVGDAGLKVPPEDVDGLAEALAQLVTDEQQRAQLRQAGLARAATFSWERAAERMLGIYKQVAGF